MPVSERERETTLAQPLNGVACRPLGYHEDHPARFTDGLAVDSRQTWAARKDPAVFAGFSQVPIGAASGGAIRTSSPVWRSHQLLMPTFSLLLIFRSSWAFALSNIASSRDGSEFALTLSMVEGHLAGSCGPRP